jgi:hypothetical protein
MSSRPGASYRPIAGGQPQQQQNIRNLAPVSQRPGPGAPSQRGAGIGGGSTINPQRGPVGQRGPPIAQTQPQPEISEEQRNEIQEAVRD